VMMQYPVFFQAIKKVRRGYYEITSHIIATPPYAKDSHEIVERYAKAVERIIQEEPSGWLWSHNRWKKRHIKQEDFV